MHLKYANKSFNFMVILFPLGIKVTHENMPNLEKNDSISKKEKG